MTSEQMLVILAASDPSAAFRAWARTQGKSDLFDDDLDSAVPPDLDPLRAYDLQTTFLHRVRRRARVLAQLRANLEHPVASLSALEWRLRGLIGIEALALKVANDVATRPSVDEALLTLADLLVVVSEVQYQPAHDLGSQFPHCGIRSACAGRISGAHVIARRLVVWPFRSVPVLRSMSGLPARIQP